MERVKEGGGGGEERAWKWQIPSPPPPPYFIFGSLSPFSARAKHQKSRSLLPNPTETLATQTKFFWEYPPPWDFSFTFELFII